MTFASSKDGVPCYACNPLQLYAPQYMMQHLKNDHTHAEVAFHLSVVYLDDWSEEQQIQQEEMELQKV